jgi:hypothetical protein
LAPGRGRAYWLARLERDGRVGLIDLIERKEISGFRKKATRRATMVDK